jgi:hypothetical protein
MAVQLEIEYDELVKLIEQLSEEQQQALLAYLLEKTSQRRLSREEKKALYHASILSVPVNEEPSIRREDWYGDDGR